MSEDPDEMLALDKVTGLVHQYKGTAPGGIGGEEMGFGIGIIPCDCEGQQAEIFEENVMNSNTVMIKRRHLEAGIWERAECLEEDDD